MRVSGQSSDANFLKFVLVTASYLIFVSLLYRSYLSGSVTGLGYNIIHPITTHFYIFISIVSLICGLTVSAVIGGSKETKLVWGIFAVILLFNILRVILVLILLPFVFSSL